MNESNNRKSSEKSFWDDRIAQILRKSSENDLIVADDDLIDRLMPHTSYFDLDKIHRCCFEILEDLDGKRILDCGCGSGFLSVLCAKKGAYVESIDISTANVELTRHRARLNDVNERVRAQHMDLESLSFNDASFDYVLGSFILHHTNTEISGREIERVLAEGGKAVFIENSARNKFLMYAREYITGRYGVPKYGSASESPLSVRQIRTLRDIFSGGASLHYVSFVFFRLLAGYIKILNNPACMKVISYLDNFVYAYLPFIRKYGYFNVLEMKK